MMPMDWQNLPMNRREHPMKRREYPMFGGKTPENGGFDVRWVRFQSVAKSSFNPVKTVLL
jgi:hypothetical protein